MDNDYLTLLKNSYFLVKADYETQGIDPPENKPFKNSTDLLFRNLDCAVIETLHNVNKKMGNRSFDSVRGVFFEGKELYPNAGFREKNHIQICIRNPNCIKGYFIPRKEDGNFTIP